MWMQSRSRDPQSLEASLVCVPGVWHEHEWGGGGSSTGPAGCRAGIGSGMWEPQTWVVCLMGLTGRGEGERQTEERRGCTHLQINSARLKAFIRERRARGGLIKRYLESQRGSGWLTFRLVICWRCRKRSKAAVVKDWNDRWNVT